MIDSIKLREGCFGLNKTLMGGANTSRGPASTLKTYIQRLGRSIDSQGQLGVSAFVKLHFLSTPWRTLAWFAERSWQEKLTTQSHRRTLINFPDIDQHLTRQVLDKFASRERRLLIREIADAFQT